MPLGEVFGALFGKGFGGKRIPPPLMRAPLPLLRELLRGLFHSDGCVTDSYVSLGLTNRELIIQAHQLLMRLGYFFGIRSRRSASTRTAYELRAAPTECPDLVWEFFGKHVP